MKRLQETAGILGVAPSTVHRWLADGFIADEQLTPAAPWQIRITPQPGKRFLWNRRRPDTCPCRSRPDGWAFSHQTVLQRVKQGRLSAAHVRRGKRKGLLINVIDEQQSLFGNLS